MSTYADYELAKLDTETSLFLIKVKGLHGTKTNWMAVTPETLERIREVLNSAPETGW